VASCVFVRAAVEQEKARRVTLSEFKGRPLVSIHP
jgi:hypothetical protein